MEKIEDLKNELSKTTKAYNNAKYQAILAISELLWEMPFSLEFKVVKNPKGVKIIWEVTQEQMNIINKKKQ